MADGTLDVQRDVAPGTGGQIDQDQVGQARLGTVGGQGDVVTVVVFLRFHPGGGEVAGVAHGDAAIRRDHAGQGQVTQVGQIDVAGAEQLQVHGRRGGAQRDADVGAGVDEVGLQARQDTVGIGGGCLADAAAQRFQVDPGAGRLGREAAVGQRDVAAIETGGEFDVAGPGQEVGFGVAADAAILADAGAGIDLDGSRGHQAGEIHVASGFHVQRRITLGGDLAAQDRVDPGGQADADAAGGGGIKDGSVIDDQIGPRREGQGIRRELGGDLLTAVQLAFQLDLAARQDGQAGIGLEFAGEADVVAGIDADRGAKNGLTCAGAAAEGFIAHTHHGMQHGLRHGDRHALPYRHDPVHHLHHLLGAGLVDRTIVVDVLVLVDRLVVVLGALVVDVLPVGSPGVGIVLVILELVAIDLDAGNGVAPAGGVRRVLESPGGAAVIDVLIGDELVGGIPPADGAENVVQVTADPTGAIGVIDRSASEVGVLVEGDVATAIAPADLDTVIGVLASGNVDQTLGIGLQRADEVVVRVDGGGQAGALITGAGIGIGEFLGQGRGAVVVGVAALPDGIHVNPGQFFRSRVGIQETVLQLEMTLAAADGIGHFPAGVGIVEILALGGRAVEGVVRLVLGVAGDGRILVATHPFTDIGGAPGAVALAVQGRVTGKEARLTLAHHPQQVFLGAVGHDDVLVAPAVDVYVVDLLGIGRPVGYPDIGGGVAVEGLVELGVAVIKVVQAHVAQLRQYLLLLRKQQALEGGAGRGRAGRAPADLAVEVMHPLDEGLAELGVAAGIGVVVADLRQGDVHGGVLAAHLHLLGAHLFGDAGGDPGDFRHDHGAVFHLDILAGGNLDDFFHRVVAGDGHFPGTGHRSRRVQGDIATRLDGDGAFRLQEALFADEDVAAGQLAAGEDAFELLAGPVEIDAGIELDAVVGLQQALDVEVAA